MKRKFPQGEINVRKKDFKQNENYTKIKCDIPTINVLKV